MGGQMASTSLRSGWVSRASLDDAIDQRQVHQAWRQTKGSMIWLMDERQPASAAGCCCAALLAR
jgi:hypothetical protein